MISLQGVTKRFDTVMAVDDVSFEIGKGEVVGMLGPNGAGKTTTMRLLTSFYSPDEGTILVDGVDTQEDDLTTRATIGYLPENNPLYEEMFVGEYLSFVAELRGMAADDREAAIKLAATETGVFEILMKPIGELSKGYRQRVGLAQAILGEPPILILDEPTEGLDPNQRVDIRTLIAKIGKKRTVLLSTHVLQEVQNTCTRVLLINKGRLIADCTVAQLRQLGKGQRTVLVGAKGGQVEKRLKAVKGVTSVTKAKGGGRKALLELVVSGREDIRPRIFELAKENDWELWELHEQTASLEDVFRNLTEEDNAAFAAEMAAAEAEAGAEAEAEPDGEADEAEADNEGDEAGTGQGEDGAGESGDAR